MDAAADLERVIGFYADAPDYWLLAQGVPPGRERAQAFFRDAPPNCDPDASARLGLFMDDRLCGIAELSFGFPGVADAYLGLMILGPWAQGRGIGRGFLAHVEALAREAGVSSLYLGVLEANPRGRAFWERAGFSHTGVSREETVNGIRHVTHRLRKAL